MSQAARCVSLWATVGLLLLAGPAGAKPSPGICAGFYSAGSLRGGRALEDEGRDHYLLYPRFCYDREPMVEAYPDPERRGNAYAHPSVLRSVRKVARRLRRAHPAAPRLPVGELSNPRGGPIPFHRSHQNGLDVDIYFLMRARAGSAAEGYWRERERQVPVCQDGPEMEVRDPWTGRWRVHGAFAHDWNWTVVSAFAAQEEVKVIFIGGLLRRALERWARAARVSAAERQRTMDKLKTVQCRRKGGRPGYQGNTCPHGDHIHVRYHCPRDSPGCRESR